MKPEFADNRELKMIEALRGHLDWLHTTYKDPVDMSIATGYFNPEGFAMLSDRLERLSNVRLLLGAEPLPPPAFPERLPGDPRGEALETKLVRDALSKNASGLDRDRDRLPFTESCDRALRNLLSILRSGKIEVRRYEKAFLHGKAFIFASNEGYISGSSNFTAAGLTWNLELNLGRYDPTPVARAKKWFDELWEEAVPYDLAAVYAARFEEHEPYLIYLRALWERYKDELEEEAQPGSTIRLTTFQNDGIFRAQRICEKYKGVLIADGVGLGKTYIAGEILRRALDEQRQRALLIAPATLRDGTWARFADRYQLYMECISYEELAQDIQLGGERPHLTQKANDYALVVIDEAQAFRNPDTSRARALRKLLQGQPPKTVILLSATPVNNSLWDLYYLLTFFVGHDAVFSDLGVRSLKEKFMDVVRVDADELRPDALFDILDATTVRRTRHFVRRYYPNDRIYGLRGEEIPVRFPDPKVKAVTYSLDDVLPGFFDEFKDALAPEEGPPKLTLARYSPKKYCHEPEEDLREAALVGLLRTGLLKRFESSVRAFAKTAETMAIAHDKFLEGLEKGVILTAQGLEEWESVDSDEGLAELIKVTGAEMTAGYDVPRLRADVEADRDLLRNFSQQAYAIRRDQDPKLDKLGEQLDQILKQAEKDANDEEDKRNKRKVLIFSYFADTVDWVTDYLIDLFARDKRYASYRGRLASVVGDESRYGISREAAVFGFVPISSEAPVGRDNDLFDVLVTTDVLAEGMNLQQCRHIINYDLPWNPMRLVQRHGRIDRIGSLYTQVFIRCFFPDVQLDALLELEARVRRKLAQAAASVGVESEVIPGAATSEVVFAETRKEIEALRQENGEIFENAGEDPCAHSGEEYRQELRKAMEIYGERIQGLAGAAGSGFAGGAEAGHFFCARIGERVFYRFVRRDGGETISDTLGCLKIISCTEGTPRQLPSELAEAAYGAWVEARKDIFEEWMMATDPANLQPKIRPALRAAADQLRKYPPSEMIQDEIDKAIEAIEAPWGVRIEKVIREAMESATGNASSEAIVEKVRLLGLQPYKAPAPLPPIEEGDIELVCWIGVSK
jgi:translation initiation factor 2 beta subunit (eIF-2beta)/eIF-5